MWARLAFGFRDSSGLLLIRIRPTKFTSAQDPLSRTSMPRQMVSDATSKHSNLTPPTRLSLTYSFRHSLPPLASQLQIGHAQWFAPHELKRPRCMYLYGLRDKNLYETPLKLRCYFYSVFYGCTSCGGSTIYSKRGCECIYTYIGMQVCGNRSKASMAGLASWSLM